MRCKPCIAKGELMDTRNIKRLFLAVLFITSSRAFPQKAYNPLNLGIILPSTGVQKPYETEIRIAVELAIASAHKSHPHLKNKLRVSYYDSASTAAGSFSAAEKAAAERQHFLAGGFTRADAEAIQKVGVLKKIPTMLLTPPPQGVSPQRGVFYGQFSEAWYGLKLARFAQTLGLKKISIIAEANSSEFELQARTFNARFPLTGGQVLTSLSYTASNEQEITTILKQALEKKPDGIIFLSSNSVHTLSVMNLLQTWKQSVPLLGTKRWANQELLVSKQFPTAHYFPMAYKANSGLPQVQSFEKQFVKKLSRYPSTLAFIVYDSITAITECYQKAQSTSFLNLDQKMVNLADIPGLLGPFTMNHLKEPEKPMLFYKLFQGAISFNSVVL